MERIEYEVLDEFMNMSIFSTDEIFKKFESDKEGKIYQIDGHKFYYKPGKRDDKILLVAHADTVWDKRYNMYYLPEKEIKNKEFVRDNGKEYYSKNPYLGIGADDRAGLAMLWLLKDSGNSILITDEEEIGCLTTKHLMTFSKFEKMIDSHKFMIQLDMNGANEFKCYSSGSEEFKAMIENVSGYKMRPNFSFTDITYLGRNICGANLSVGYYNEHSPDEILNKKEWFDAFNMAKKLSEIPHKQYYVEPDFGLKYRRIVY